MHIEHELSILYFLLLLLISLLIPNCLFLSWILFSSSMAIFYFFSLDSNQACCTSCSSSTHFSLFSLAFCSNDRMTVFYRVLHELNWVDQRLLLRVLFVYYFLLQKDQQFKKYRLRNSRKTEEFIFVLNFSTLISPRSFSIFFWSCDGTLYMNSVIRISYLVSPATSPPPLIIICRILLVFCTLFDLFTLY
jgi:hypothetical protein